MQETPKSTLVPLAGPNLGLGFIVFCLVALVLFVARDILIPFMVAVCLWYLINVIARIYAHIRVATITLPRAWCLPLGVVTAVLLLWMIVQVVSSNIALVATAAPNYQHNLEMILPKLIAFLGLEEETTILELARNLDLAVIIAFIAKNLSGLAGKTIVVFFYTLFLLNEQRFFKKKLTGIFPNSSTLVRVEKIIQDVDIKTQRYLLVKIVIGALTGSYTFLVLRYYGVDFGQFWGLLAFILNFIPYLGSIVAVILPALISLVQFGDISTFGIVALYLTVLQMSLGNFIDPRLLGESLNLSPIMILLSIATWGMLWGVAGMFLAVPILLAMVILLSQFPRTRPLAIMFSRTGEIGGIE